MFYADELKKPVNVHRWRQLRDTDPETFAMIKRVQKLHKKITKKSDEVRADPRGRFGIYSLITVCEGRRFVNYSVPIRGDP